MTSKRLIFIGGVLVLLVTLGFAVSGLQDPEPGQEAGLIDYNVTEIPGAPPIPDWLAESHPMVKTEYIWAASHVKELQYIPCYCGCGHSGHSSNLECFYDLDSNGRIVAYDSMSAG